MKPFIHKLGTIDLDIVETTPLVFRGRLYRFEYIRQHLVRSVDLRQWQQSPFNPFLDFSAADYLCKSEFPLAEKGIINRAVNINNSDADLCEYENKVIIYYSWGDQKGVEFLAEAFAPGPLNQFLASWFPAAD